ncbi:signal transduction histidine kinase [Idiomarina sp. A28L]|uniref:sensor histidine kinase n=1 Tax=Idiomarina sp. A28L TaxID=1036674 RepID=UPI0002138664|nr:HAMP domain-containing sensor histidine kinase [Idiomarina sp. A28L]EGN74756.1 signal transduction histidine kinase [Idiomarina sp. A28L]
MAESTQNWSLSSRLNIIIAGIVALAMLLFTALSTLLVSDSERRSLVNKTEALAQQLAIQASNHPLTNQYTELLFSGLSAYDSLEYVHLYTVHEEERYPVLAKSYMAAGRSVLAPQSERIENLPSYQFALDFLEIAQPIFNENELSGYIYVRASLAQIQSAHRRHMLISIAAFLIVLLSVSLSVRFFVRTLESTLLRFSRTIANASQDHSFDIESEREIPEELFDVRLQIKRLVEKYRHEKRYAEHSALQAQRANEELEAEVAERTQSLSEVNRKLTNALETLHSHQRKHLEQDKMASLGDLIAGLSHELNTPIGSSITATSFAQEQQQQILRALNKKQITEAQLADYLEQSEQSLEVVMRNLRRCSDLIRHFQEMAMMNRTDTPKQIALSVFLQRLQRSVINERGLPAHIDIKFDCSCGQNVVNLRVLILEQVLLEIIDNAAVHASIKNEANIAQPLLILVSVHLDKAFLNIEIKDNGSGIAPELKQKIFQPFITTRRAQGDTGLGLYQVFNWVTQLLNGEIECESIPYVRGEEESPHGTTFSIKIPILNK